MSTRKSTHFDGSGRKIPSTRSPGYYGTRDVSARRADNPPRWQRSLAGMPSTPRDSGYGLAEASRLESIHGDKFYKLAPELTEFDLPELEGL